MGVALPIVLRPTMAIAALDPVTLGELRLRLGSARLDELLALFTLELEQHPTALRGALVDRDFAAAAFELRGLRQAAANLGATRVSAAARAVEGAMAAASVGRSDLLQASLGRLATGIVEARQAIAIARRGTLPALLAS